ncbi:MAG: tetratricopeptide repeat protein [Planctomycetota bacterium]|jgi:tetratricopeptide (TPR) repeat protein
MARKRLNKKVTIVGSLIFALLILLSIALVLYMSRDPKEFVKDGDASLKSAREATDDQVRTEEYKRAERNYLRARSLSKNDEFNVGLLFKLANLYLETKQFREALGCWNEIVNIQPDNIEARQGRLEYVYIVADSEGGTAVWQEVVSQASGFIKVVEKAGILGETISQRDYFNEKESLEIGKTLGSYLFMVRGRAKAALAKAGAATEPEVLLTEAIEDLKRALEYEKKNVHIYKYLSKTAQTRGDIVGSRGDLESAKQALQEAQSYLQQAIDMSPEDVVAHINMLNFKLDRSRYEVQRESLRKDYLSLVETFENNPKAIAAISRFYRQFPKEIDKAVKFTDKALELDPQNGVYALRAASQHYQYFSLYKDKSELYRTIEIAKKALDFPSAQLTAGPRSGVYKSRRIALYYILATCYIEQLLEPIEQMTKTEKEEWLQNAEDTAHQIEQLYGSGENPQVVLWQGLLELAKGEKSSGTRKAYDVYKQLKVAGIERGRRSYTKASYAFLSYALAMNFKESPEKGAVYRFLNSALLAQIALDRPQVILDFVDQAVELGRLGYVFSNLDFYDSNFGANSRSKRLRILAYISGNQFEEAERELADTDLEDVEKTRLKLLLLQSRIRQLELTFNRKKAQDSIKDLLFKPEDVNQISELLVSSNTEKESVSSEADEIIMMELKKYGGEFLDLIEKYIQLSPESIDEALLNYSYRNYLLLNRVESAKAFIDTVLSNNPDNLLALFYKEYLLESEPLNIGLGRGTEIQKRILLNMPDSVEKWLNLGGLYMKNNQFVEAAEQFNKILQVEAWEKEDGLFVRPNFQGIEVTRTDLQIATNQLFGYAIERKDLGLAKKLANIARIEDLDECEGQYFYARLAVEQQRYEDALNYINKALILRPVFSHGYMLRSTINGILGNKTVSVEDAREALGLNPQNPDHVKRLALSLCQRNLDLGDMVTSEQKVEARTTLDNALALNSSDGQLLSFYAEYISLDEPYRALAIRQYLYENSFNVGNALLLGAMAMKIALSETNESQKDALLDISGQALAEAYRLNPGDRSTLDTYAQYYRLIGEDDRVWELLEKSEDKGLLWNSYYRQGRYAEANTVLQQMYANDPTDANSLFGLLMVSREIGDIEGVIKYSESLVSLGRSTDDYLIQIQTFLEVGLVREAELKLQSFMERFPDETRAFLLQAWLMMRQGRLKNALEVTNRHIETNEEKPNVWELRGKIHYLIADYNQAISDFNRSRSLFDSPQLSTFLSKAYMRAGRGQEAIIELKKAIESPQISNNARILLEDTYKKLNRKDELNRYYDETIRALPDNALWHIKAASFAQEQGDFSKASGLYKRALQLNMENGRSASVALDGYLNSLISDGKYSDVFEIVPDYINGEYASIALFRMAEAKLKLGDRTSAIEYCQKALDGASPGSIITTRIVDKTSSLLGKEVLYKYCQDRMAQNPDSENINLIMFNLMLMDNEQYNKAIEYIDKCIQIADSESPQNVIYILEKARVLNLAYEKTSDNNYLDKAVEEHKSLLQKMPNNIGVLNNLAFLLAESGQTLDEAMEYARRAYEAQPNNPNILDTYAFVLYKNGKYEQAADMSQAALQHFEDSQSKTSAQVYEHLGMIREKLGLRKEAVDAYEQALVIGGLSEKSVDRINSEIDKISQNNI